MAYNTGASRETAAFNLAMPYLTRVNAILNSNYTEFKAGNTRGFAVNLRQLYRELVPWLVVDLTNINPKKRIDMTAPFKKMFGELARIPKNNREAIWEKMEDIENEMRIHFKQLGMLMPKVSDPRFLFGNKQK